MLKRLLQLLGLRRKPSKLSPREEGNRNHVMQVVRAATHPELRREHIKVKRIPAEGRVRGMWCIRSPWHNGAWIGGYYMSRDRLAVTVANPDDLNDYDDRVEQHEIAHWAEDSLGLVPPWHYGPWRHLFLHWESIPAYCVGGGEIQQCDKTHLLPYCECGDVVEVDYV
jgi:hypothetical protein